MSMVSLDLSPLIRPVYTVPTTVKVFDLSGSTIGDVTLPPQFLESIRPDLILRAYLSALTARLQPKGTDPMAGNRTTAVSFGIGLGIARVPRVKGSLWPTARIAPNVVKGRRAHPPKVEKILHEKINKRERRKAIRSAIASTAIKDLVIARGHLVDKVPQIPLVVNDDLGRIGVMTDLKKTLMSLGLWDDIERVAERIRIRSGKGKMRGRRYKEGKSVLIVVPSTDSPVIRVARNLPGVDVVPVRNLSVLYLAPGGVPGRLTLWTLGAIEELRKGLFMG
ncbi:50S ribosomal protein L4 [Vulcanisaeta souniana]|uniref:Large ribosomal subunit protein uL4 n=1 Tax=Vulcanisaeta souniana JCM 11219 TaxID=1293586 RepID=A0A830EGA1_9CREN|nr:50S ribosomal protein L4 [Vulcanisaeta souniana]BDR92035.1 50S ribosomal protein L4 [Vulcanisaeta souniana JCM 11219]GGI68417.1 50S ribosomal protein L4 [Vulcanisaeta souniana JCM 11219]